MYPGRRRSTGRRRCRACTCTGSRKKVVPTPSAAFARSLTWREAQAPRSWTRGDSRSRPRRCSHQFVHTCQRFSGRDMDSPKAANPEGRFALLLAGELRTLPTVIDNFESNVLAPLQPADVFLHLSLQWSLAAWSNLSGLPRPPEQWPMSAYHDLHRRLKAIVHAELVEAPDSAAHFVFVRWAALLAAMRRREQERSFTYAHVVRSRPDLVYHCSLSRTWLQTLRYPLLSWDVFASFPRDFADVILARAAETWECTTRIELCVPGAIVTHANSSYYDIPADFGTYKLATIFRHSDCPADLPRCLPTHVSKRTRCAARLCNEPQAVADAHQTEGLKSCASKGHVQAAVRTPLSRADFRKLFLYHVRGNPWCQCRVQVRTAQEAMASRRDSAGLLRYYASPCMNEAKPSCCRFGGETLRAVVEDARRLAYPTGCKPWFEPALPPESEEELSSTSRTTRLRRTF